MINNKQYDENYNKVLSDYFINLRLDNRKTFEEVANAVNVKPNTFYNYEKGTRDMPISVFISLCNYFGKDYCEVFKYIGEKANEITLRQNGKV